MSKIEVRSPSNIAIVKYMGKMPSNIPENGSLSLTLSKCHTHSTFSWIDGCKAVPASADASVGIKLVSKDPKMTFSSTEEGRMGRFVQFLITNLPALYSKFGLSVLEASDGILGKQVLIETSNTFPKAAGIASSASSFSAVTIGVAALSCREPKQFYELFSCSDPFRSALANLSRQGSGSSCRSFFGPWTKWQGDCVEPLEYSEKSLAKANGYEKWVDFIILVSKGEKSVGSSEAHRRVKDSPLWLGRADRANNRLTKCESYLVSGDLFSLAKEVWAESFEMHSLFHTSNPPFTYWVPESLTVLDRLKVFGEGRSEFPGLVTMDAGPNVHFLVEAKNAGKARAFLAAHLAEFQILEDESGLGPVIEIK